MAISSSLLPELDIGCGDYFPGLQQLDQFIKVSWHSLFSYRATLVESYLQPLEVSLQARGPVTLFKQHLFNQCQGEMSEG